MGGVLDKLRLIPPGRHAHRHLCTEPLFVELVANLSSLKPELELEPEVYTDLYSIVLL